MERRQQTIVRRSGTSPAPLILGLVLLVIAGAGYAWYALQDDVAALLSRFTAASEPQVATVIAPPQPVQQPAPQQQVQPPAPAPQTATAPPPAQPPAVSQPTQQPAPAPQATSPVRDPPPARPA